MDFGTLDAISVVVVGACCLCCWCLAHRGARFLPAPPLEPILNGRAQRGASQRKPKELENEKMKKKALTKHKKTLFSRSLFLFDLFPSRFCFPTTPGPKRPGPLDDGRRRAPEEAAPSAALPSDSSRPGGRSCRRGFSSPSSGEQERQSRRRCRRCCVKEGLSLLLLRARPLRPHRRPAALRRLPRCRRQRRRASPLLLGLWQHGRCPGPRGDGGGAEERGRARRRILPDPGRRCA